MGTSVFRKPPSMSAVEFICDHTGMLKWSGEQSYHHQVLDTAMVGRNVMVAAVEHIHKHSGTPEISASVFLLTHYRPSATDSGNFGVKDLHETMGIAAVVCPERILSMLTPTEDANSNAWRQACRALKVAMRERSPRPGVGAVVHLLERTFVIEEDLGRKGARVTESATAMTYRLTAEQLRRATVIPATNVTEAQEEAITQAPCA